MIYMNSLKPLKVMKAMNPMKAFNKVLKPKKGREALLLVVLVVYILTNVQTPGPLAKVVDNVYGNVAVTMLAIAFFMKTKSVAGVLSLVAAYELIKRSSMNTGSHALRNFVPSEHKKLADFAKYNEFPMTLEEEMVAKLAPLVKHAPAANANYKPILSDLHEAASATSDDM